LIRAFGLDRLFVSLMQRLLRRIVRFETAPAHAEQIAIDPERPVCYALQVRQLSALLVLDDATRRLGLPRASAPLALGDASERSSFFFLTRSGQPSPLQRNPYRYSQRLERLVRAVQSDPALDVQVVPVNIFWGRAPGKQASLIAALLADSWVTPGALRQLARLLIHGRQTLLKFGDPIPLRAALGDAPPDPASPRVAVRRVARLLRAQFRRERELAVGPNLSHRQTLVNDVIRGEPVQAAIAEHAAARSISRDDAELAARRIAFEIASDYSHPFIRAYEIGLRWLWNRLYNGVELHRFDDVAHAGAGAEIVYVPCHRSHVDYLLLSYVIYTRGLLAPHIAAGENLNLPLVGALLRRGGAFFLRRSFKGDALYAAVFGEYLHTIVARGFPIEYFVEGGRSRTGRMLVPKTGMLGMTVDSFLRDPQRPVVFVPVYIGYEQVIEGDTYVAELAGTPKRKESLFGLARAAAGLRRRNFGKVHVNVGAPIRLAALLEQAWPDWRGAGADASSRRFAAVNLLAREIVTRINDAVVVAPVNLVATALLGAPGAAMDAALLSAHVGLLAGLARDVPVSPRMEVTTMPGADAIEYARRHALVERVAHPLGEIVRAAPRQALLLTYFRNNVLHAFALPALVACLVARSRRIAAADVHRIAASLVPFLRAELFLSVRDDELAARLDRVLAAFASRGLASAHDGVLEAPAPAQPESVSLHALARAMRQPLERYYLVVRTLARFGPGQLSGSALEGVCLLLAQRLAILHEPGGADFTDRSSFRSIIRTLVELGRVQEHEGRLGFGPALEASAQDADLLLGQDVGLAISHATQLPAEELTRAAVALGDAR